MSGRPLSDSSVLLALGAATAGALRPSALPLAVALALVAGALASRRGALVGLSIGLLVSSLAGRSLAGLDPPREPVAVSGEISLVTDPEPSFGGLRAEARLGSERVLVRASGTAATALRPRLAGEIVAVEADLRPLPQRRAWLTARHIARELRVVHVAGWRPGGLPERAANAARRTLVAGATSLDEEERSLYAGLVMGDDRHQPAEMADDFLGAGLTHLLAVSGQNVAFVVALLGPLGRRMRLWPRLLLSLGAVALFGVMTRFEPSVLRAAVMAGVALTATTVGRPTSRLRVLALAATALLVVDPLLVRSVGFQLSTAASAAIVVAARPLAEVLPGPSWVREPLAVTTAAQLGVAPVLVATFGPLPVASFPANLLAVPVAGAVMVWGLTAGMVAGLVPPAASELIHGPTRLLLGWLSEVAARGAALPLGQLRAGHLAVVAAGLGLATTAHRRRGSGAGVRWGGVRRAGLAAAAVAVLAAGVTTVRPPPLRQDLLAGVVLWRSGTTDVVVLGGVGGRSPIGAGDALAALRQAGVGGVEVVVAADPSVPASLVETIERRHPLGTVVVARGVERPQVDAVVAAPPTPTSVVVGGLEVHLFPTSDRVVVEARRRGGPGRL